VQASSPLREPELEVEEQALPPSTTRSLPLPLHSAWLTRVLIVFNVLLFVLLTVGSLSEQGLYESIVSGASRAALIFFGAKVNTLIVQGEWWRLLTPAFLHIGVIHLLFNQYALSIFGRELESLFGTARFAIIYLLAGIAGNVASFAFSPALSAGASGAIFGVIGAMAMFFVRNRQLLGEMGKQQFRSLLGMIGINLFLGVTLPGIDNYGHLGGLAAGLALGALLSPTYTLQPSPEPPSVQVVERRSMLPTSLVTLAALGVLLAATFFALSITPLAPAR
jgi:rhomboid protease GluP